MRVNLKDRQAIMRRAYLYFSMNDSMSFQRYWSTVHLLNLLAKVLCNP